MGLRDLYLESCYETESSKEHLLEKFYIPVLKATKRYYRIAGFFSSTALTVAAEGIEGLCQNHGHMYLLVSPQLSRKDFEIIQKHQPLDEHADLFQELKLDEAVDDHLKLLAYLLDQGFLEIKIVVCNNSPTSLFHQKVGIMVDERGDMISFSGSINETAQAWLENIEEFKVFRSWELGQQVYVDADKKKFEDYWSNRKASIATVYDIPEAVREKIVKIKPKDPFDLDCMKRYKKPGEKDPIGLFQHQREAVQKWKKNQGRILMEMATGTGKTRTAIGCIYEKMKEKKPFLTIVATPQNTLSRQWQADMEKVGVSFDYSLIADGTNPKWKKKLESMLLTFWKYTNAIVYTTHATASSDKFIELITKYKGDTPILFICDEVHGIGSDKQQKALLPCYEQRIGLSATPERLFDEEGTQLIRDYFGNQSFEFGLWDALHTKNEITQKPFLNPYVYHPLFVHLSEEEKQKWDKLQRKIRPLAFTIEKMKKQHKPYQKEKKVLDNLYEKRADIVKNAEEKMAVLDGLLDSMDPDSIQDTLLFTSNVQMDGCMQMLAEKKITRAKITEEISASKTDRETGLTERQEILKGFAAHSLQVVLGIKCMDEGIDITTARVAIILASSTNPREYIQRVGRVIRPAPGKQMSEIYDFIVLGDQDLPLLKNEEKRVALIAQNADNYMDVYQLFKGKGVDLNEYQQEN